MFINFYEQPPAHNQSTASPERLKRTKTYTQNRKNARNNNITLKQPKAAVNGGKRGQIACSGDRQSTVNHQHYSGGKFTNQNKKSKQRSKHRNVPGNVRK
ncbi:hypothetical protein QL285_061676 [Trifolium repens]|jgi:hypothetical protein|nr:hypothetical protein QL285_061676 [Trifolium repens]